jgi:serine/threonine protein kinase
MAREGDIVYCPNGKNEFWYLGKLLGKGGQGTVHASYQIRNDPRIINAADAQRRSSGHPNFPVRSMSIEGFSPPSPEKTPDCAIKVLDRPGSEAIQRFKRDYNIVLKLDDPRIIKYFEFCPASEHNENPWIRMEFVKGLGSRVNEGLDLGTLTKKGAFRDNLAHGLRVFKEIVDVLRIVHENDVIHRDIKPANILVREDMTIVVSDFGCAHWVNNDMEFLTSSSEVGARGYIAPELQGTKQGEPSRQSDIYSLGKTLYCMLSMGHVIPREDFSVGPLEDTGQMHYVFDHIFNNTIRIKPDERFSNCDKLIEELDKVIILMEEHFYPSIEGRKCIVCGEGFYQFVGKTGTSAARSERSKAKWDNTQKDLYVCSNCGNIQVFAP